ncbi:hypothetical protein N4G58_08145 [Edwardsiella piscicida]|nr:hypothetical protein N4G58_08145 [Edwardsiella piscicida]
MVSQLSALRDDPLRAMEQLTQQGVVLNETIIQQISALERRGKRSLPVIWRKRRLLRRPSAIWKSRSA